MNIGQYSFEEFKAKAAAFHGYPAPGLLLGGYMVEKARAALPPGTLFEVVVESKKCLPDAVQLLTPCSAGNNWMKVLNLGRYALSMFDKYTGEGARVYVDVPRLAAWPELRAWFLKEKAKADQDAEKLLREIEEAGDSVCGLERIHIRDRFRGHARVGAISVCPSCGEAFPAKDGVICRGCQGEAPYTLAEHDKTSSPRVSVLPAEQAVGRTALHDMTRVLPGESKGAEFLAGQVISADDVRRLQHMGRFSLAVSEGSDAGDAVHENDAALAFARRMPGANILADDEPREGKIGFRAGADGLFSLDAARLLAFNLPGDIMCAARQDAVLVEAGGSLAATRIIPLYIGKSRFAEALELLHKPLFSVLPLRRAKVGILVTGTEVFNGLIEDKFIPTITAKVEAFSCSVVLSVITPDDKTRIGEAVERIRAAGADLLVTTGGLSVDPEDVTRAALIDAGLVDALHGAPVLPGAMMLVGRMAAPGRTADTVDIHARPDFDRVEQPGPGEMQVIGAPACVLFHKTTLFDALLPRLLAGRCITRPELAGMGEGGLCLHCKICAWPKCFFMK
ncbi:MAG: FmdE family protein [Desulfovibrio sp.]|jgi:formylmethanofuran dehydrogenase subunit E|nr:FmdE family protein [Desulfovibrio sp.]